MYDTQAKYEKMSFVDKIKFSKTVYDFTIPREVEYGVSALIYNGYLREIEEKCVFAGEEEYYVYLWKHAWGGPFYVGSGKNNRWRTKNGRCDDFYLHLDQADAVVYKVLDGVDAKTAHLYEKYISVSLTQAGYTLANGDYNYEYASEKTQENMKVACEKYSKLPLSPQVESAVLGILGHEPRCDYRVTDGFIMKYGVNYFSSQYMSGARERRRAAYKINKE